MSRAAVLNNCKAQNMNPKHFTTIRHALPAKMRLTHLTTSSASQNWQISGVEHVGQKVVTRGWRAFCTERTTCGLIPFQLYYVSAASQLYATARKFKSNHSTYTKHSYGKHDNFPCPIYFRNVFNTLKLSMSPNILVQVQHYTITQLYSTPNVCQFTKYVKICHVSAKVWDQVDLPKLTNWMISLWFWGDSQPSWPEVLATMEATPSGFRIFSDRAASDLAAYEQVTPG